MNLTKLAHAKPGLASRACVCGMEVLGLGLALGFCVCVEWRCLG